MRLIRVLGFSVVTAAAIFVFSAINTRAQSGMECRGTIDDHVQVIIRNQRSNTRTLSGTDYRDVRCSFNGGGGRYRNDNYNRASVDKQDGRGKVWVVQQPNRRNNFTTIIQIDDPKGGADRYRFYVRWD